MPGLQGPFQMAHMLFALYCIVLQESQNCTGAIFIIRDSSKTLLTGSHHVGESCVSVAELLGHQLSLRLYSAIATLLIAYLFSITGPSKSKTSLTLFQHRCKMNKLSTLTPHMFGLVSITVFQSPVTHNHWTVYPRAQSDV